MILLVYSHIYCFSWLFEKVKISKKSSEIYLLFCIGFYKVLSMENSETTKFKEYGS